MRLPNDRWMNSIDTLEHDLEAIGPLGVVRSLTRERRFFPGGPPRDEWNVASHSLLVATVFLKVREEFGWDVNMLPHVLIHDFHEFLTRDIPSPIKKELQPAIGKLQDKIDDAIIGWLGLTVDEDDELRHAIRTCDLTALLLEAEEWGLTLELAPSGIATDVFTAFRLCGGKDWPWRAPGS